MTHSTPQTPTLHAQRHVAGSRQAGVWRSVLKIVGIVLAVILASGGSIAAIVISSLTQKVSENAIAIGGDAPAAVQGLIPQIGPVDGGFNLLVVGTDNDESQGVDTFGERDATLNDVNILLHVNADHSSAVVVSLPRDLIVSQPECTNPDTGEVNGAVSYQPLNDAYERGGGSKAGGLACAVATVSSVTGLPIQYAALISFNGVIAMSDAVGGVPICLTDAVYDPDSGLDIPAGISVVKGESALQFLRTRHGVGDGSDLSRISSQQQYMSSLLRVIKSDDTWGDPAKLYTLARVAVDNVSLSTSMASLDSMVSLALTLKDIDLSRMVFVQYPGSTGDSNFPGKVVPNTALADELFSKIANDVPFTIDATVPPIGIEVPVTPEAAPDPAAPEAADPSAPAPAPGPEAISGLSGQTAAEETCTVANN